ncbi:unnamed protein product [Adineta ricciae]|uniref:Uncharacterized protein n=1 Tax=Adineta ricciae TaxID=249248 RepID=A0A814UKF5_ADIRI|nr:unnamed protein product [Adineta ricciae]
MAACIVEEASAATPIHCQTTNIMEHTPPSANSDSNHHRCSFTFHTTNMKNDSSGKINQEATASISRKRRLSQTETYSTNCVKTQTKIDSSCQSQAVPINATPTTPTRPTSLSLTNLAFSQSTSLLRTCLSHPSTSPSIFPSSDDNALSPFKFTSLPELSSPSAKRLRPQTLCFTPTCSSVTTVSHQSSSIGSISPTDLADKMKEKIPLTIFDCGSPFRHSEHRIRNSILLRVADKISRKRLKTNGNHSSAIDSKQLHESQFIILYDDNNNTRRQYSIPSSSDDEQLSAAFKCAYEEIKRYLTTNSPSILILNCPFSQFLDLYPLLCESLQPRSCPSSPTNHVDESSPPQTAPPTHTSFLLPTTTTTEQPDIDNHPMTHIIDGLYIGSETNAKNLEELSSERIRSIVNVTSHVPLYHSEQFQYCHLPADDTQKQNLLEYFDQAYSFICKSLENNEKVLVHCVAGISRSPAIVIGFLMRYAKMNMNDAYDFVKRKRSIVSPNLNFMGQLLEYEKKLKQDK